MDIVNVTYAACIALVAASVLITGWAFWRRGFVGLGFGLLSLLGTVLAFVYLPFAVAVATEQHFVWKDFFSLLGMGLLGLVFFATGSYMGLRRKRAKSIR